MPMDTTIQFGEDSMLKTMRNEQNDLGPLYIKPIVQLIIMKLIK